jgi:hypothetical protein
MSPEEPQIGDGLSETDQSRARPSSQQPTCRQPTSRQPTEGSFSSVDNRLVLMAIDPYWVFAYWGIHPGSIEIASSRVGDSEALTVLRFYEVGLVEFDGTNASNTFDITIDGAEGNYYLNLWSPGKSLVADFGVKSPRGEFVAIVRSNYLRLPTDTEVHRYEERWSRIHGGPTSLWRPRGEVRLSPVVPEAPLPTEELTPPTEGADTASDRLAADAAPGATPGLPPGAPPPGVEAVRPDRAPSRAPAEQPERTEALPAARSPVAGDVVHPGTPTGIASTRVEPSVPATPPVATPPVAAPPQEPIGIRADVLEGTAVPSGVSSAERPPEDERPSLEVKADIVIYGSAQPGSEVIIDGVRVPVRSDGTFDVRFALPASGKGKQAPAERPEGES